MGAGGMARTGFSDPIIRYPAPTPQIDIGSITRVDSIVLSGLDFSMRPEHVRYEVEKGFINAFPKVKVKHIIKSLAIMVYSQIKSTPMYHGRVCNTKNALAFFLCAIHRQQAPQPMSHSRQNSNSSMMSVSEGGDDVVCQKNCVLPKLITSSMLPLGNWDSLYYALVAEVHRLHSDLQTRFGFGCENGTYPLHYHGHDGKSQEPVTAIDLASLLESAWYALMDSRLVATLDKAVRMKNFVNLKTTPELISGDRPPVLYGLIDVNALDPDTIIHLLWEKYRAEVDAACLENFEDESLLSEYRAQQYRELLEQSMEIEVPLSANKSCKCHRACVCKLKCDNTTDICTCNHEHIYRLNDEPDRTGDIMIKYVKESTTKPSLFVPAMPITLESKQAPGSSEQAATAGSSRNMSNGSVSDDSGLVIKNHKRINTNDSELAYVPSSRASKDAYPLDFYGRKSGDRYHTVSSQSTASSSRRPSADQGSSPSNKGKMPARKPVPTTPTSPGPLANFTYPTVPVSQSQYMFTQSFPAPGANNPRDTGKGVNGNKKSDGTTIASTMHYGANDYSGLLGEHPSSSNEQSDSDIEPFPKLTRAVTTSPPRKVKLSKVGNAMPQFNHSKTAAGAFPTLNTINKPIPPLPEPNFIAPKPAVKQRYVSAGGNTPLSRRPEIEGPALHTPSPAAGRAITKEELDAKMSDPEWVRRNFGEDAVIAYCTPPRMSSVDEPRDSKYSSKNASKRNSGRKSDESDRGTPRDRTSSSASKRGKLMRLFSRQDSINEAN